MQYPQFRRDGWPIGSGMVESANKNVVEVRLKGTGMHWERTFPGGGIRLDDPLVVIAALEAMRGLVIEASFIATFTQRFLAR